MTKEEKDLSLMDLCSRLPYHIRIKVWLKDGTTEEGFFDFEHNYGDVMMDFFFYDKLKDLKPYLRPMSSMTEEEALKLWDLLYSSYRRNKILEIIIKQECIDYILDDGVASTETFSIYYDNVVRTIDTFDWLNSHHFDYRGLINLGLALEAPKEMYKF